MKLPIFEIITILDFSTEAIVKQISLHKLGQTPLAFDLRNISPANHLEAAQNIADQLHDFGVRAYFPYPLFVISRHLNDFNEIPVVKNKTQLPSHFVKRSKRLKNKEASLMNKVQLLSEKIENYNATKKLEELKKIMKSNKKLYDLSKELNFYQTLLNSSEIH